MSRSRKKPIYKDRGLTTQEYWKPIRHNWKQHLNNNYLDPDLNFESPKTYVNDYNKCDYWFYVEESPQSKRGKWWSNYQGWTKEDVERYSRK